MSLDNFNKNLEDFLNTIVTNYPEQKEQIDTVYTFPLKGTTYVDDFIKHIDGKGLFISTKNEIIFSKNTVILKGIDFNYIWNDEKLTNENRENIWKYFFTLYIYAFEYVKNTDSRTFFEEYQSSEKSISDYDEITQNFLNIIESLTNQISDEDIENLILEGDEDNETEEEGGLFKLPEMMNGPIGDLIKDISSDLDLSKLKLKDPMKIIQNFTSGNMENDESGIMDFISDVKSKLDTKLKSGAFNEKELFSSAKETIEKISKSQTGSGPQEKLLQNMFSHLSSKFNELESMVQHAKTEKPQEVVAPPTEESEEDLMNSIMETMKIDQSGESEEAGKSEEAVNSDEVVNSGKVVNSGEVVGGETEKSEEAGNQNVALDKSKLAEMEQSMSDTLNKTMSQLFGSGSQGKKMKKMMKNMSQNMMNGMGNFDGDMSNLLSGLQNSGGDKKQNKQIKNLDHKNRLNKRRLRLRKKLEAKKKLLAKELQKETQ